MVKFIGEPDWIIRPATRAVINALEAARPAASRFVGGCVRNTLMERDVDDIDIATQLTPQRVMDALDAAGVRAIPTGIDHGTVTAISGGAPYEITTLRRDVETDGRRAVVAFTEDWSEDAQRRDFRLNALYAEPDGRVHDPIAGGLADALAGRVIFIGDADDRLREDYLRILRFFRFNAWYGAGIDPEGLAACGRQKAGLEKIAAERIWKEFRRLLAAPQPADALSAMADSGVLEITLPGVRVRGVERVTRLVGIELVESLPPDPMRRLMALLPRDSGVVRETSSRLRLSNAERDRLTAGVGDSADVMSDLTDRAARARLYRIGAQAFIDRVVWESAQSGGPLDARLRALIDVAERWTRPEFSIGGAEVAAAGIPPGPLTGEILRELEDWWIEGDFAADRLQLTDKLTDLVRRRSGDIPSP